MIQIKKAGINWELFVKELKSINYKYHACVEIENKDFEDSFDSVLKAIKNSYDNVIKYF